MENETKENNINEVVQKSAPKFGTPAAIVAAGFLIMIAIIVTRTPAPQKIADVKSDTAKAPAEIILAPLSASDHVLGDPNTAQVTMVEFSDTECPFCKVFHESMKKVMATYPGKVAWVYRHFPLDSIHPKTRMEARATECVAQIGGNNQFWKYLDLIFATTPSNNKLDPALLPTMAEKVGVNKKAFADCFANNALDAKVEASFEDGQRAGVQGTPHTILITRDGQKIPIQGADEETLIKTLGALIK